MNSSLYKAHIMHHRLEPKKHSFHYDIYLFYLDLDEITELSGKLHFMSRNRFNLFNFKDKEHIQLPRENPDKTKNIKEHLLAYLKENGIGDGVGKIMLLTNLNTLGYNFNPVSFYFCFDTQGNPLCVVPEISNTFGEMKPYFLGKESWSEKGFRQNTTKNFYVSPFFDHDTQFDFNLPVPGEKMHIKIDNIQAGRKIFISTLTGKQEPLTDSNLLRYFFSIPLITIKVISLIHWNAMMLMLKKVPYRKKKDFPELQQGVYRPYKKERQEAAAESRKK
jgi:DUF1365 family protein